jgi:4,5-dihydroxyphthalate decarboxylase
MAITMAVSERYDAAYLVNGSVPVKGFDIQYVDYAGVEGKTVADIFSDQFNNLTYDLIDWPFTNYLIAKDMGKPVIAIPAFPTLFNPLRGPMVNRSKGIKGAKDLEGRKIGVFGLAFNPATWLRGMFQHHYGVDFDSFQYYENEPNSMTGVDFPRPDRYKVERTQGIMTMVSEGDIDAVIMADGGIEPTDSLDRLFPDYWTEIQAYYDATGVLPTNSVVVVKEETLKANPGLAKAVADAFAEAWARYSQDAADDDEHMGLEVAELRRRGFFPHTDGLEANRKSVEKIVQYAHEQGFIKTRFNVDDLFAKA